MTIGSTGNNTLESNTNNGTAAIARYAGSMEEYNRYKIKAFGHTHPWYERRFFPSNADKRSRDGSLELNPNLKFYILTYPQPGGEIPYKIDYTKRYE